MGPGLRRLAGQVQRERQADDAGDLETGPPSGRPPGRRRSGRRRTAAPVAQGWSTSQANRGQPGLVELGGGAPTLRPAVRQGCSNRSTVMPALRQPPSEQVQVHGVDAATGAVAEHQDRPLFLGAVDVEPTRPLGGVDRSMISGSLDAHQQRVLARSEASGSSGSYGDRFLERRIVVLHAVHVGGDRVRLQRVGLGDRQQPQRRSGSVRVGSSQASIASRRITIGIRSWMWPAASVASVVITEQVRSQAESSSRSLVGSRQIS